ncbi:MAG: hypothetical protein IKD35_00610 [Clostridia bacterium]|nr:hypothetical protein [Clostridia bacterium]
MCSIIVCVASEICQVLFAHNAWVHFDEDDDVCRDQVVSINNKIARTAVAISFACFGSVAFYLPIVKCYELISKGFTDVYAGENHFFLIGGLTAICALFGAFAIYTLFVRKALHKKGIIVLNDHEEIVHKRNKKMMSTMAIVFLCVTIVFCVGMAVLNNVQLTKKELYSSWGDVKATTEHDYNQWVKENFGDDELMKMYADKEYKAYKELVEAYEDYGFKEIEFYYHKDHYTSDGFAVVYPEHEYLATAKQYQAVRIINDRVSEIAKPILYSVLVADVVISAIVYYVLARKNKNQDLNDEAVEEAI